MGARASQFFCDRERIILTVFALEEMKSEGSQRPVPLGDPAPPRGRISRRLSCHAWTCLLGSGSRYPCVSCRASRHCRRAGVRFGTEPAAPPSPGGVRESVSMPSGGSCIRFLTVHVACRHVNPPHVDVLSPWGLAPSAPSVDALRESTGPEQALLYLFLADSKFQ